ncbi:MAG: HAMP domain-containing protein [Anaerolineales bacterium]|nr:HAMP domain-containing protein [Anaerolineales bacterium]
MTIVTLVTITTLTAGVPAYLIVRSQLNAQAWAQVHAAREATRALYRAESEALHDLATLLAERPTLLRLLTEGATDELPGYLDDFRKQSKLDFTFICDDGHLASDVAVAQACPPLSSPAALLWMGRPALMATAQVGDGQNEPIGRIAAGIWLDEDFVSDLAGQTVAGQTLLDSVGNELATSISPAPERNAPVRDLTALDSAGQMVGEFLTGKGEPHLATYFALPSPPDATPLVAEIALSIRSVQTTEQRALAILIASTFAVAILGAVVGAWLVHRLTTPLAELTAAAERISHGDFLTQVPVHATSAEAATLSTALAKSKAAMLGALDESARARDWLFNLIQSIDEGVLTYAPSGVVTFMSRSAEMISGWPAPTAVGRLLDDVLPITEPPGATWHELAPAPGNRRQVETTDRNGRPLVLDVSGAQMSPLARRKCKRHW